MRLNSAVSGFSGGPATVTEGEFDRGRPSGVQIAPIPPHSVVAASDTVTASLDSGSTLIVHRWFWFCATRFARVTFPLVAVMALSRSIRYGSFPPKSSLNRSSKLNSVPCPPCSARHVRGTTPSGRRARPPPRSPSSRSTAGVRRKYTRPPCAVQSVVAGSDTVTVSAPIAGRTVIVQRWFSPLTTRETWVTDA